MSDTVERLRKMASIETSALFSQRKTLNEAATEIEALRRENQELRKALEASVVAIDDWLNIWAEELCDPDRVAEAKARTNEYGTLWYIATTQEANRRALMSDIHREQLDRPRIKPGERRGDE